MLSEQKMSIKLLLIGLVLLIAAVKGKSLCEHYVIGIFISSLETFCFSKLCSHAMTKSFHK